MECLFCLFVIFKIQDLCFLDDGKTFLSCGNLVARDSADRNIMAWDFNGGAVISNQIFHASNFSSVPAVAVGTYTNTHTNCITYINIFMNLCILINSKALCACVCLSR